MSAPCSRSVPAAGRTRPEATLNSVVLPAPLGPISPVIRPTGAVRLTSLTATCPPYLTVTWARSRPAGALPGALAAAPATRGCLGLRPPLTAAAWSSAGPAAARTAAADAVERSACSRLLRGVKPSATCTAATPNRTFSQSSHGRPGGNPGRQDHQREPAAPKAYQGSRPGMMTSSASRVSELNEAKSVLVTVCTTPPNSGSGDARRGRPRCRRRAPGSPSRWSRAWPGRPASRPCRGAAGRACCAPAT